MAAFPQNPSSGQVFETSNVNYRWTGAAWEVLGAPGQDLDDLNDVSSGTAATGQGLKWNGNSWVPTSLTLNGIAEPTGSVDLSHEKIINLAAPTTGSDAANRTYVDGQISGLIDGAPDALNTLNELSAALGNDEDYAAGVTTLLAGKSGILHSHTLNSLTAPDGNVSLATKKITNLATPTDPADASTKGYTDTGLATKAATSHEHSGSDITSGSIALNGPISAKEFKADIGTSDDDGFGFDGVDNDEIGIQTSSNSLFINSNDSVIVSLDQDELSGTASDSVFQVKRGNNTPVLTVNESSVTTSTKFSGSGEDLTDLKSDELDNKSVTVVAGAALTGGGEVVLGQSTTLNVAVDGTTIENAGDELNVKSGVFASFGHNHALSALTVPTSSVDLNSQNIENLAAPTADHHASTKAYTDAGLATKAATSHNHSGSQITSGDISLTGEISAGEFTADAGIGDDAGFGFDGVSKASIGIQQTSSGSLRLNSNNHFYLNLDQDQSTSNQSSEFQIWSGNDANVFSVSEAGVATTTKFSGSGEDLTNLKSAELENKSVTVVAGAALTGGGSVTLGQSTTLDVAVDGTTIENAGDALNVKSGVFAAATHNHSGADITSGDISLTGEISAEGFTASADDGLDDGYGFSGYQRTRAGVQFNGDLHLNTTASAYVFLDKDNNSTDANTKFYVVDGAGASAFTVAETGDGYFKGDITADSYAGSGALLTSLPSDELTGDLPVLDGSALTGISKRTTKGDLEVYTTTDARLPVGTNGQVLTADSAEASGLKWGDGGAGTFSAMTDTPSSITASRAVYSNAAGNALEYVDHDSDGHVFAKSNVAVKAIPTVGKVGGIGLNVRQWLTEMFYPFIPATLSFYSESLQEFGLTTNTQTLSGQLTDNDEDTFDSGTFKLKKGSTVLNTFSDPTGDTSWSFSYNVQPESATGRTVTYKIELGVGNDGSDTTISTNRTVSFAPPTFHAKSSSTMTPAQIMSGGHKHIINSNNSTHSYDVTAQYMHIAYPSEYGVLTSVKDGNNFEYWDVATPALSYVNSSGNLQSTATTRSFTLQNGQSVNYYVYRWNNLFTSSGSGFSLTFT